jgi:hypothetical protein
MHAAYMAASRVRGQHGWNEQRREEGSVLDLKRLIHTRNFPAGQTTLPQLSFGLLRPVHDISECWAYIGKVFGRLSASCKDSGDR